MVKEYFNFSNEELRDIIIVILSLSAMLSIYSTNIIGTFFLMLFLISISLFVKIIVHKIVGKRYDCNAIFTFDFKLLIVSLLISLSTKVAIIFPILGSIVISSALHTRLGHKYVNISTREAGIIALSGSLANVTIALLSLILYPLSPAIFQELLKLNVFMALFSMVPLPPIEGHYVLWWNRLIWVIGFLIPLFLFFFSFSALLSIIGIILLTIITFILWEKMF
jgi:hypothetical protein